MSLPFEKWSHLAGMRFVLASMVMLTHIGHYTGSAWASALGSAAFEAIAGFLLISGYSIGSSYGSKPEGFYIRRAERIYPAYISALLLNLLALGWPGALVLLANFLLLNQLVTSQSWLVPAWSLSLEVWLYALTPLLARLSARGIWALTAVSFVAYLAYQPMRPLLGLPHFAGVGFGFNLLLLAFFWLAGFILSTQPNKRRTLLIIGIGLLAHLGEASALQGAYQLKNARLDVYFFYDVPRLIWRGIVLASVVATFYAIIADKMGKAKSRVLNIMGDVSYPLYLVHVPIIMIGIRNGWTDPWALIAAALVAATASMLVFEYPIRHLRRANKPSAIATLKA